MIYTKEEEYDPNLPSEAHSSTQQQTTPADSNVPQQAATTNSQPTQSNPVLPDVPELHTMELKITSNFQAMENSYVVKAKLTEEYTCYTVITQFQKN